MRGVVFVIALLSIAPPLNAALDVVARIGGRDVAYSKIAYPARRLVGTCA
jgi:hypothetical protein